MMTNGYQAADAVTTPQWLIVGRKRTRLGCSDYAR
jgi:hypothetical protein